MRRCMSTILDNNDVDSARADGAAPCAEEAIAYVQHGRGQCKRLTSGWASQVGLASRVQLAKEAARHA